MLPLFDLEKIDKNTDLVMLAPWVVAARVPAMMYEFSTPWHAVGLRRGGEGEKAVIEKAAAIVESYGAVQAEIMQAGIALWAETMLGNAPNPVKMARSIQDINDASMEPMAKRVRQNYRRLRRRQTASINRRFSAK